MSYKVVNYFVDLQDSNHPYKVGDSFPRLGLKVSDERLKELSSSNNKQGKALIELVKDDDFAKCMNAPVESSEVTYTKTEINRMSTAELRELAGNVGIACAETMKGGDLKKQLIKKFNL